MTKIESIHNTTIKQLRKLKTKKGRQQQQQLLIEGVHLVREALNAGVVQTVYVSSTIDPLSLVGSEIKQEIVTISPEVAASLADTVTNEGIFAVISLEQADFGLTLSPNFQAPWLILDDLRDPGNVGTMIRTADAAGFGGVFLGGTSVDRFNPKVMRAMHGSQFHIKIMTGAIAPFIKQLHQQHYEVMGTLVDEHALPYTKCHPLTRRFAVVIGNEAHGLSPEVATLTDQNLYIPIWGKAESLNAAVAAGVVVYGLQQQVKHE